MCVCVCVCINLDIPTNICNWIKMFQRISKAKVS